MKNGFERKRAVTRPFPIFEDRQEAGKALAQRLAHYRGDQERLLLALSPGGVVVGRELALLLGAPMVPAEGSGITAGSYPIIDR
jgi:adenine/guanine phosphoribosyltransferase-like PRPP-binding protein